MGTPPEKEIEDIQILMKICGRNIHNLCSFIHFYVEEKVREVNNYINVLACCTTLHSNKIEVPRIIYICFPIS